MSDSTKVYTADQDGERLDRFLTRMEPTLSRAHVQKVIAEGQALVSGRVRKANYKLQAGEEVTSGNLRFVVDTVERNRIDKVHLYILDAPQKSEESEQESKPEQ